MENLENSKKTDLVGELFQSLLNDGECFQLEKKGNFDMSSCFWLLFLQPEKEREKNVDGCFLDSQKIDICDDFFSQ